jgi:hypothetical protein
MAMLESELRRRLPDTEWHCLVRPIFYGPRMAELAGRHCADLQPKVVYLSLLGNAFTDPVPIAAIRRRWPSFYPRARQLAELLKSAAGGHSIGGPRGAVYRLPRWLAARVAGAEPEVDLADAVRWSTETLSVLARYEDAQIICGFSSFTPPKNRFAKRVEAARNDFRRQLRGVCEAHHIAFFDRPVELAKAGLPDVRALDEAYAGLGTRRFEAEQLAGIISRERGRTS